MTKRVLKCFKAANSGRIPCVCIARPGAAGPARHGLPAPGVAVGVKLGRSSQLRLLLLSSGAGFLFIKEFLLAAARCLVRWTALWSKDWIQVG